MNPDGNLPDDNGTYQSGSYGYQGNVANIEGELLLKRLKAGAFTASLNNAPLVSGTFRELPNESLEVTVNKVTQTFADGIGVVRVDTRARVSGTVVGPNGERLTDVTLTLQRGEPTPGHHVVPEVYHTDSNGRFVVPVEITGKDKLSLHVPGFTHAVFTSFPVGVGQEQDLGRIPLTPAPGRLTGQIIDENAALSAGIYVLASGPKTGESGAYTDAKGRFTITDLLPGESLTLTVSSHNGTVSSPFGSSYAHWGFTGLHAGMGSLRIPLRVEGVESTQPIESVRGH